MEGVVSRHAQYEECDDGRRSYWYYACDGWEDFAFDAGGELIDWNENTQFCLSSVCGAAGASSTSSSSNASCRTCEMRPNPASEGTYCIPRGINNGPSPECMVDADGHWVMPKLCDD